MWLDSLLNIVVTLTVSVLEITLQLWNGMTIDAMIKDCDSGYGSGGGVIPSIPPTINNYQCCGILPSEGYLGARNTLSTTVTTITSFEPALPASTTTFITSTPNRKILSSDKTMIMSTTITRNSLSSTTTPPKTITTITSTSINTTAKTTTTIPTPRTVKSKAKSASGKTTSAVTGLCLSGPDIELIGMNESSGNVFATNFYNCWGPVCDRFWDDKDADVACRQLGYDYGSATTGSYFGEVPSNFVMTDMRCQGNEDSIQMCSYKTDGCLSSHAAGLHCYKGERTTHTTTTSTRQPTTSTECPHGQVNNITLFGGENKGNVFATNRESCLGPVCDKMWDEKDAKVVCRQLGFDFGYSTTGSYFGYVSGTYSMSNVNCNGSEEHLQDCSHLIERCYRIDRAGVYCCRNDSPILIDLVGGNSSNTGNVWTSNGCDGTYGPVCDRYWRKEESDVVCRQLGYDYGFPSHNSYYGSVGTNFSMDSVRCFGNESIIQDCPHLPYHDKKHCGKSDGAGVRCCKYDSEKIVELHVDNEKSEELYYEGNVYATNGCDGSFGSVCDSSWDDKDAQVVCRQLDYGTGCATHRSYYGDVTQDSVMYDVDCDGSEQHLQDCSFTTFRSCGRTNGGGVRCYNNTEAALL